MKVTKKGISIILSMVMIISGISVNSYQTNAEDDGIIEISSAEELAKIGNDDAYPLDGSYKLVNDIENVTTTIGQGEGINPTSFTGKFDGDGHSVTLNINAEKTYQGLIGTIENAIVKNVIVKGKITSTLGYAAGITPKAIDSTISNCGSEVQISVSGNNQQCIAGIVGYAQRANILNCYNNGTITGKIKNTAGIVGQIQTFVNVENCYNAGEISTTCTSAPRVGGLAGYVNTASSAESIISSCYNVGTVTGSGQVGSVFGYVSATTKVTNCAYLENTHENAYGFGYNFDDSGITKVSSDELKALSDTLGDAYITDETINDGYPILTWQKVEENTDAEDTATLEALVKELPSGVIRPKFYTDKNINTYIRNLIEAKEAYADQNITVSVKSVSNRMNQDVTYIEEDGTINYFYKNLFENPTSTMNFENVDVVFELGLNNVSVEYKPSCVQIYWDVDKVKADMETVAENYITEQILANNDSFEEVTGELLLPVYPKVMYNDGEQTLKWVKATYTSSDNSIVSISEDAQWDSSFANMNYKASVNRDTVDKDVTITATFTFDRYTTNSGEDTLTETITKEIAIKVLGYDEAVEESKKLAEKLDSYDEGLKDFATGEKLNTSAVTNDIQLPIPRDLGIDGKYYDISVESSDTSVVDIYGYRTFTYRPLPNSEAKDVTLKVTITNKGNTNITASKEFTLTIVPLTDEEIDHAVAFMEKAKENFFDFIKGENADKEHITSDLKTFYGIYEDENGNVYSSNYVDKPNNNGILTTIINPDEIVPDNKRYWISSDVDIIEDQSLRVTQPEYNKTVTVGAMITHEGLEKYADKYADDAVYGEKLAKLKNQAVTCDVTVLGTKGEETTTEEVTTPKESSQETTTVTVTTTNTVKETANTSKIKKSLKIKKLKCKKYKKKIKLTWKRNKKADGYIVKYKKASTKVYIKKTIKTNKKHAIKIKRYKKMNVRLRAYKKVNGKKIYGAWKKLKIK